MKTYMLKRRKEKSIREWLGSSLQRQNHLHAMGRQRKDEHQQGVCTLHAQSLTPCKEAMARSGSARGCALCKHNHLHTVGKQWQDQDQQEGLHFASTITYSLWEGNGKIRISKGVCTVQAKSLTCCGKAMAGSGSARGSALCEHNHLQAVGRQ